MFNYNLNINLSNICKKCEASRDTFKSNNVFHTHIREYFDDKSKLNQLLAFEITFADLSLIKSNVKDTMQKKYDF